MELLHVFRVLLLLASIGASLGSALHPQRFKREDVIVGEGTVTVSVNPDPQGAVQVEQTFTYSGVSTPNSQAGGLVGTTGGGTFSATNTQLTGPGSTFTFSSTAGGNTINVAGVGPPGAPLPTIPPMQPFPTFAPFPSMPGFPSLFPQNG